MINSLPKQPTIPPMPQRRTDQISMIPIKIERREPIMRWIPCSERLPKTNDPVNVTWINRNPEVYYMDIKDKPFTATAHYYKGRWYWYSSVTQDFLDEYGECESELVDKDVEITAWMPLPEPYAERRQDETN